MTTLGGVAIPQYSENGDNEYCEHLAGMSCASYSQKF